jgi:NADP-dependent 3-hydroxy acid dehydrogenase YdfG
VKKTVLITGASSGIGKATARLFAGNGWNVVAAMRDPAKETELAGLGDVLVTRLDVRDCASIGQSMMTRNVDQDYVDFMRSRFPSPEVAQ